MEYQLRGTFLFIWRPQTEKCSAALQRDVQFFLHKASVLDKTRVYQAMSLFCKAVQKISDRDYIYV